MHGTAVGATKANKAHVPLCVKALDILKAFVADPKTAGLPDPNVVTGAPGQGQKRTANEASSQAKAKAKQGGSAPGTYASAVTGKANGQTVPIGAKTGDPNLAKVPAKYASGAIGAPAPAKNPATASNGTSAIGAPGVAKQGAPQPSASEITSDSALQYLQYLKDAPASQSFDEYQVSKANSQTTLAPNVSQVDVDDDDDPGLQQALLASRQQSQPQGSDPTASSPAAVQRSIQEELFDELEVGRHLDGEAGQLEQKLYLEGLTIDELERFRKISQLKNTNMLRVAELCEQRIHEIELSNCKPLEHLLIICNKVHKPAHHRGNRSNRNPPVRC